MFLIPGVCIFHPLPDVVRESLEHYSQQEYLVWLPLHLSKSNIKIMQFSLYSKLLFSQYAKIETDFYETETFNITGFLDFVHHHIIPDSF